MGTKFCTTIKLAPPDRAKADRLATAIGCSTSDLLRAALHDVGDADVPRLRARVQALHESTEEARRAAAARRRSLVLQEVAASPDGVTYADLTAATGFAQGSLKAILDDLMARRLVARSGLGVRRYPYRFRLADAIEEMQAA